MTRATLKAGLTRLRRGLREYFGRGRGQDESAGLAMSPPARIAERWDAAIRRLEAARVLRDAGLSHDALILFREAGLLLARATIDRADAAPAATSPSDQTTAEKLIQVLESERRPVPVGFARDFSTLVLTDSMDIDRLSSREATLRAERADSMTRWLADAVEPRSPRQRRATRNLRISLAVLAVLAIPVAREIWVLSPTNISFHKKVTASTEMPNKNAQGVVDGELYGLAFQSTEEGAACLSIDLGKRYLISDAEVFGQSIPLAFEVSDDGKSYRQVATKSEAFTGLLPWVVKPLQVDARFVRLRLLRQGSLALSEVVVYGRRRR
jgi:hypothetical protein